METVLKGSENCKQSKFVRLVCLTVLVTCTFALFATNAFAHNILNGEGHPSVSVGVTGDFYIDTVNFKIYGPRTASGWIWGAGTNLMGPRGPRGARGARGAAGAAGAAGAIGAVGPAGAIGAVGPTGPTGATGPSSLTGLLAFPTVDGGIDANETATVECPGTNPNVTGGGFSGADVDVEASYPSAPNAWTVDLEFDTDATWTAYAICSQ